MFKKRKNHLFLCAMHNVSLFGFKFRKSGFARRQLINVFHQFVENLQKFCLKVRRLQGGNDKLVELLLLLFHVVNEKKGCHFERGFSALKKSFLVEFFAKVVGGVEKVKCFR